MLRVSRKPDNSTPPLKCQRKRSYRASPQRRARRADTQDDVDYLLRGKTAYVSAGAHGIGEAIADLLAAEGAVVLVSDQDADALRDKAHKWRGTVAADLATADGIERAVEYVLTTFGDAPDIVINNLGVGDSTPFEEITDERWAKSIDVNLMGAVRTCRALVPRMAARGSGAVVNTGSDLAKQPEPGFIDYGACKAALLYLTKALAKQYAPGRARQHRAAGADLVAHVDEARRHRRSARGALRHGSRHRGAAVSSGSADADGHRPAGRRGARGGVPRLAARQVHHRRRPRHRRHHSRVDLSPPFMEAT